MMAFMLAQGRLQQLRLNPERGPAGPDHPGDLAQPCCQCYGATVWAGIDRLLIGAAAGRGWRSPPFDEGPLPADWVGELHKRGHRGGPRRQRDTCAVLKTYGELGGYWNY